MFKTMFYATKASPLYPDVRSNLLVESSSTASKGAGNGMYSETMSGPDDLQ